MREESKSEKIKRSAFLALQFVAVLCRRSLGGWGRLETGHLGLGWTPGVRVGHEVGVVKTPRGLMLLKLLKNELKTRK